LTLSSVCGLNLLMPANLRISFLVSEFSLIITNDIKGIGFLGPQIAQIFLYMDWGSLKLVSEL